MTWTVCVDCGEVAPATRCEDCQVERGRRLDARRGSARDRGYTSTWDKLSARARRLQPFCTDCETTENLTTDHSPQAWERHAAGKAVRLRDVAVVCLPCNVARGAARGDRARMGDAGPLGGARFASQTAVPSRQTVYGAPTGPPDAA